jgi:hypothetical protein
MEVGQGPNWGSGAKEKNISSIILIGVFLQHHFPFAVGLQAVETVPI